MRKKIIHPDNGYKEKKLLSKIYISNLPENLMCVVLSLSGCTYFNIERKEIEHCYRKKKNLLTYWGFNEAIPFSDYMLLKFNDNNINTKDEILFEYVEDINDVWIKTLKDGIDINFYDKRIEQENFLRCKNGLYGIGYST